MKVARRHRGRVFVAVSVERYVVNLLCRVFGVLGPGYRASFHEVRGVLGKRIADGTLHKIRVVAVLCDFVRPFGHDYLSHGGVQNGVTTELADAFRCQTVFVIGQDLDGQTAINHGVKVEIPTSYANGRLSFNQSSGRAAHSKSVRSALIWCTLETSVTSSWFLWLPDVSLRGTLLVVKDHDSLGADAGHCAH